MFARRTNWEMTPNQISERLAELRGQGREIYDLTVSNPTRCGIQYPQGAILAALNHPDNLHYSPGARGLPSARTALCAYYGRKGFALKPEQIFLTASTSEAYSYLFRLLADPGDTVLFPRPSYPLFQFLVDLNDLNMEFYTLRRADGWRLDHAELAASCGPRVKALVGVNPNNPTGSYIHPDDRPWLCALAAERGIPIISDEVFFDYCLGEIPPVSLLSNAAGLTFVLGGLSKELGLPQMKLSWLIVNGPPEQVAAAQQRLEVIADTYLSVNAPAQNALPEWLALQPGIAAQIHGRVAANLRFLETAVAGVPSCEVRRPQGGWYGILRIPNIHSEEHWVLTLLSEDQVYVHPGYFFDFEAGAYLILSLLTPAADFQEGVRRILARIAQSDSGHGGDFS